MKQTYGSHYRQHPITLADPTTGNVITDDGRLITLVCSIDGMTSLSDILETCVTDSVTLVCPIDSVQRQWYDKASCNGWIKESFNFADRTYRMRKDKRIIQVKHCQNGYFPSLVLNVKMHYKAYNLLRILWKQYTNIALLDSASRSGLVFLEHSMMKHSEMTTQSDEINNLIIKNFPQSHNEIYEHNLDTITDVCCLDGRWMYAGCIERDMPVTLTSHDYIDRFVPYVPGMYKVTFTVPESWSHIGLLPFKSENGYIWPSIPGNTYTSWVYEPELRVAFDNGWIIFIEERYLFAKGDRYLAQWRKNLIVIRDRANDIPNDDIRDAVRGAIRNIMLHAIGSMHAASRRREIEVDEKDFNFSELTAEEKSTHEILPKTTIHKYVKHYPLSDNDKRYYLPHISAYIWSYCRMRTNLQMLRLPYETIIACRVDAIYATFNPQWIDTGNPGCFRIKSEYHGSVPYPIHQSEIAAIMKEDTNNVK